jgi:hypothetical protein
MEMLADAELLTGFERASLPNDAFHHAEHVRVAWLFVQRYGLPDALGEFSRALKRFATAKGKPGLYHETITWAFILLIADRMARQPATTWQQFAGENPDLLTWKPSVLDRYYTSQTLWSDVARRTFVWPDRTLERGPTPERNK